jgi:hypothetical protein
MKAKVDAPAVEESLNMKEEIGAAAAVEKATTQDIAASRTIPKSIDTTITSEEDIDIFLSPNTEDGVKGAVDFRPETNYEDDIDIYGDETLIGSEGDTEEIKEEDKDHVEDAVDIKLADEEPDTFTAPLEARENKITKETVTEEDEITRMEKAAEEQVAFGRAAIFTSIEQNLNNVEILANSIGQGVVNVTETRYISAGGIKLEVSIKFLGTDTIAPVELDEKVGKAVLSTTETATPKLSPDTSDTQPQLREKFAPAPPQQTSTKPCLFGHNCTRRDTCSFAHPASTPKICTYLNSETGCIFGAKCKYLHPSTDRPKTETAVSEEGSTPPVHEQSAAGKLELKATKSRAAREASAAVTTSTTGSNASSPPSAPTQPMVPTAPTKASPGIDIFTSTKQQGQKRSRGDDHLDEGHADGGHNAQRLRTNGWVATTLQSTRSRPRCKASTGNTRSNGSRCQTSLQNRCSISLRSRWPTPSFSKAFTTLSTLRNRLRTILNSLLSTASTISRATTATSNRAIVGDAVAVMVKAGVEVVVPPMAAVVVGTNSRTTTKAQTATRNSSRTAVVLSRPTTVALRCLAKA